MHPGSDTWPLLTSSVKSSCKVSPNHKEARRGKEPGLANIAEHDTITNVLVHKSFCVLLLMSLNIYRKIVEVDSTNICMLLMHVLDFYILALRTILALLYSPLGT